MAIMTWHVPDCLCCIWWWKQDMGLSLPLPHKSLSRSLIPGLAHHWLVNSLPCFSTNLKKRQNGWLPLPEHWWFWHKYLLKINTACENLPQMHLKTCLHPLPFSWAHIKWRQSFMSTTFREQQVSIPISWAWLCKLTGKQPPLVEQNWETGVQMEMWLLRSQQLPTGWQRE